MYKPKPTSQWLKNRALKTGKTVEELRAEMALRSSLANKSKSGFASMDKNKHLELSAKGGVNKAKNKK